MHLTWLDCPGLPCVSAGCEFCELYYFPLFFFFFFVPPFICAPQVRSGWVINPRSPLPKTTAAKWYQTSQRQLQHRFRRVRTQRWKDIRCNIWMSDQSLQEGRGWKDCGLDLGDTQAKTHAHTFSLQQEAKWILFIQMEWMSSSKLTVFMRTIQVICGVWWERMGMCHVKIICSFIVS